MSDVDVPPREEEEEEEEECAETKKSDSGEQGNDQNTSAPADGEEVDHVCVCATEDEDCTPLELPLASDGTLPCSTLSHSFPKAVGLKYKNPATGLFRSLPVDEGKKCVMAPKGGWQGHRYVAIIDDSLSSSDRLEGQCGQTDRLNMPVDLFVRNLSFKTTEEQLKKFFEQYGEVQYAEVKKDYRTGLPRGYGFIKMKTLEDQEKVLKEGDFYIDGRMAQVKYPDHGQDGGDQDDRITTKIYVGRVYAEITEADLHKLFDEEAKKISPLAKVERVFLPKPCRGFAYVSLNDPKVVKRLCQIRDFVCAGKSIYVSIPRPKKQETEPIRYSGMRDYRSHPYRSSYGRWDDEPVSRKGYYNDDPYTGRTRSLFDDFPSSGGYGSRSGDMYGGGGYTGNSGYGSGGSSRSWR
uniref:RRM domain-containing protein n=1 Tax=Elaeophora elaphi TaxID=1147741 RepID=A0A0R3S307_9BILA